MKPITLLFVFVAFVLGIGIGGLYGHRSAIMSSVSDTPLLTARLAADTSLDIAYLYRLRDGQTDVVRSLLESQADSSLVLLGERLAHCRLHSETSNSCRLFRHTKIISRNFHTLTACHTFRQVSHKHTACWMACRRINHDA
jgi:hypothetical protein